MKHFLEVLFVALAIIFFVTGSTGMAIWSGMFAAIWWFIIPNPDLTVDYHAKPEVTGDK